MTEYHQVPTREVTVQAIMRDIQFRQGFEDAQAGLPPNFDKARNRQWGYERGRQFAIVASPGLKLWIKGKLNPAAVKEYERHLEEGGL